VIEATGKEERSCEGEDCGIASERLAFEPKARGIGPRSGLNQGLTEAAERGQKMAMLGPIDSSLANIALGVSLIEPDPRRDHTGIKGEDVGDMAQIYSAGKRWFMKGSG